jgi:CRISPR-associated protein Cas5
MPDLSFFLEPPALDAAAVLHVEALAPLSLVASQPGQFYRSQAAPTEPMLYGLLENALGWHFDASTRKALLKGLREQAKEALSEGHPLADSPWIAGAPTESGLGFASLLQWHLRFVAPRVVPEVTRYVDLWNQHLRRDDDKKYIGGSRHYDPSLEEVLNRLKKGGDLSYGNSSSDVTSVEDVDDRVVPKGATVWPKALKPRFPRYYVSPTQREYVVPHGPYAFRAACTPAVAALITDALDRPAAPLYLGSNDGWVNARWEAL